MSGGVAWCMVLVCRGVGKAPWHDLFKGRFLWKCCSQSKSVQSRSIQNNAISQHCMALKARQSTSFPHPQVDWRTPSATRSTSCMKASHVAEGRHLEALEHEMRIAESFDGAKDVVPAACTIGVENQEDMNYHSVKAPLASRRKIMPPTPQLSLQP